MCTPQMPQQTFLATTSAYVCTLTEECINSAGKRAVIGDYACPRDIKLGSRIRIDGEVFTCNDRTNLKYNGRYDKFMGYMDDDTPAREYGLQVKEIEIL